MATLGSNNGHQCPFCFETFSRRQRLESHLRRKTPCHPDVSTSGIIQIGTKQISLKPEICICKNCSKQCSSKENLAKHIKTCNAVGSASSDESKSSIQPRSLQLGDTPKGPDFQKLVDTPKAPNFQKNTDARMDMIEAKLSEIKSGLQSEINELKDTPKITQNILQVVCVGRNDNYLEMLANAFESFDKAITYIKNCALASVAGDCKLIEKIYFQPGSENSIKYTDKSRTTIEYYDENKKKTVDTKSGFGRRLANNLQSSYLKGVNYLITNNMENRGCPNKFLEEYDLQAWNQHIFDLLTESHQRKIINNLNIPIGGS